MIVLKAKIRKEIGKKVQGLREKGLIPAVLYGPKLENLSLEVQDKEFEEVFKQAGESSLINLEAEGKKFLVLIHALELDALSQKPIHIDFYQPDLSKEITAEISLVFEGDPPAVKELSGVLVKNIQQIMVKALPQHLPHEIKVSLEGLKTFEDNILVKDLAIPEGVKAVRDESDIVARVVPLQKVEEELEKPMEEKVEEVEKVGEKEKEAKAAEEAKAAGPQGKASAK
jgi:large subunit ribosomal protein L25